MSPANHFQPVTLSRANAIALLDDRADSRGARPSGRTEGNTPAASLNHALHGFSESGLSAALFDPFHSTEVDHV